MGCYFFLSWLLWARLPFQGPCIHCWASDPLFLPLGPNGLFLLFIQSIPCGPHHWAFLSTGLQQMALNIVLKEKSYMRTHARSILGHVLVLWLRVLNSSFLLLYFFNLLLSLSLSLSLSFFLVFFLLSLPLNPFSYYILWFLHQFLHPRVGQALGVIFLCSPLPLLKPSTLSCKAACSLFRHHLHINAARELAGQHLMRR